jgi:predicted ABC-type transport system involved in lysophospholipase L1 biosynthesis ATPase subunit
VNVPLARPLGFVELDRVWLDDRTTCSWALADVSFVAEPGMTVALVSADGRTAAADAVLDLLGGSRLPTRGHLSLDGVDLADLDRVHHLQALRHQVVPATGERRLTVAGRTALVARPTPSTLRTAGLVVTFDAGGGVAALTERRTDAMASEAAVA